MATTEEYTVFPSDNDLDFSFTSLSSDRTSARSSLARSSLTLSFNDRLSTTSASPPSSAAASLSARPHRHADPNWSAIKTATTFSSDGNLNLSHLKLIRHLGTGNLGRVFLCRLRDCESASFALKVVDREHLTAKKISHVETEAEILSMLDHPFLPTLYAHITASHYTCLLIDYCPGGDLHALLRKQPGGRFSVSAVRFFAAEVLVALEYLHALGIVYRDLKPENILLREDGHVMLSDFDLCFKSDVVPTLKTNRGIRRCSSFGGAGRRGGRVMKEEMVAEFVAEPTAAHSRSCVGTHEYLAPELLSGGGHGNGVDWWAFGVLMYELLHGATPFKGGSKESTLRNIASTTAVRFDAGDSDTEKGMAEARDLIEKLLVKDPRQRLGCDGGATDLKKHPFFAGIKWPLIRSYRPPEVRGLMRKPKSKVAQVSAAGGQQKRRRWWWKGLEFFMRAKGSTQQKYYSKNANQSNGNCYRYFVNNNINKKGNYISLRQEESI